MVISAPQTLPAAMAFLASPRARFAVASSSRRRPPCGSQSQSATVGSNSTASHPVLSSLRLAASAAVLLAVTVSPDDPITDDHRPSPLSEANRPDRCACPSLRRRRQRALRPPPVLYFVLGRAAEPESTLPRCRELAGYEFGADFLMPFSPADAEETEEEPKAEAEAEKL
ncbi:hypothetical protein ABZP36_022808 [Zizania latifolia]